MPVNLLAMINELYRRWERVRESPPVPAWDDQQVSLGSVGFGSSAPTETAYKGSEVLSFHQSQDNSITFVAQLPHAYKINSDIEFHLHLAYQDANAGNSKWTLTHSWASIGSTFPAETSVSALIASPAETDHHQLADIAATITPAAGQGGISSVLLCSLTREGTDGTDTYGSGIYLVSLDFHRRGDGFGSRQRAVK